MALRFSKGAPKNVMDHVHDWVESAAKSMTDAGPTVSVSEGYQVVSVTVDDLAAGRLLDAVDAGRWRFLVLEDDVPHGELEIEGDTPVALHRGPAKNALVEALDRAHDVKGDHEVRVLSCPGVRFVGLWLHHAERDCIIPFHPNATDLPNLHLLGPDEVIKVLQPLAVDVQKAMAGAGGHLLGG